MYTIREGLVYEYLRNRNEDEFYTVPAHVAGYWLHHANHNPLNEFDKMVRETGCKNDHFYKLVRNLIIESVNQ